MFHERDNYQSLYTNDNESYYKSEFYDKIKAWLKQIQPEMLYKILSIQKPHIVAFFLHVRAYTKLTGDKFFSLKCEYNSLKQLQMYLRPFSDNFFGFNKVLYDPSRDDEISFFRCRAIKILLNKIRIVRTLVPYDTITFSKLFMDDIDAWMDCFTYVSQNMFLIEKKPHSEQDFQMWFNPKNLNTISAWVVAFMEHNILVAYDQYNQEDIYPCINLQREDSLIKIWKQLGKKEKQKLLQNSLKLYDNLPKVCFESNFDLDYFNQKKQQENLNNFEFFFKFLCKQNFPTTNVDVEQMKKNIEDKIQQQIQLGDMAFVRQCLQRNLDESFGVEKLFMDYIGLCLEQKYYTSKEFLEEGQPQKKQKKKKRKKKKNKVKALQKNNDILENTNKNNQENCVQYQLQNNQDNTISLNERQNIQYEKIVLIKGQQYVSILETLQLERKEKDSKQNKQSELPQQIEIKVKQKQFNKIINEDSLNKSKVDPFQDQWQEYKPKQVKEIIFKRRNDINYKQQQYNIKQQVVNKKEKRQQKKIKKKKNLVNKFQQKDQIDKSEENYKPIKWKDFVEQDIVNQNKNKNLVQQDEKFFFDCEIQIFIQQHTYNFLKHKFNKHLEKYYDKIQKESQVLDNQREQAIILVKNYINSVFEQNQIKTNQYSIKTYGSFPNKLLTIHSDLDITIIKKNDFLNNQQLFSMIDKQFQSCDQLVQKKLLLSASFPVLKIDLKINQKIIQIDIIIEDIETQQSQKSTNFVQQCIQEYPTFSKNILILKNIFGAKNFNQNYQGGLSSYPLSVVYASFLVYKKLQKSTDLTETLLEFMKFLFHDFDHQKQMIIFEVDSEFILQQKTDKYFFYNLVVVNKNLNDSNLTNNSSLYHKIKFYLYQIYSKFYKLYKHILPKTDQKLIDFNYENINNSYEITMQEILGNNDIDAFFDIRQINFSCKQFLYNIFLIYKYLLLTVLLFCRQSYSQQKFLFQKYIDLGKINAYNKKFQKLIKKVL